MAVASVDRIYTSTDSGLTWRARESPRNWTSITSSADGRKLAAVTRGGPIYTSSDSGATWTPRATNRLWGSITSSADCSKLAATVVDTGQIYTSIDSGATWTARATSGNRNWWSITSSADGSKLAAVVNGGQIYTSAGPPNLDVAAGSGLQTRPTFATSISPGPAADAGQTVSFTVINNNNALFTTQPEIASDGTLTFTPGSSLGVATMTVTAVDNGGTAAGGSDTSPSQTFTISILPTVTGISPSSGSTAGGTRVTITGTNLTGAIGVTIGGSAATSVVVDNDTSITCTTSAGTAGTASVLVTTPGGTNVANTLFTYQTPNTAPSFALPAPPGGPVWRAGGSDLIWRSITSSADGSKLAAVVIGGQIYTSTDSGATWTARESNRDWTSITSSADGCKLASVAYSGQIYTSSDSGATWTARESSRNWTSITSSADGSKLAAVAYPGRIYISNDSGVTWTARDSSRDWNFITSSADGSKLAAVVYEGRIYTSIDSGDTWTARDSGSGWWRSITSSADGSKLAAVLYGGRIYTSTDSGDTWTARENSRGWLSITSSADGSKLAAVVDGGQIYTSTDSGATWTARENNRRWRSITSSADGSKLAAVVYANKIYTLFNSPSLNVVAGSGMQTRPAFATSISPGSATDAGQTVNFTLINDNNALFTTQPEISSDGTLTFTPGNTDGVATVIVTAMDNGGTAYGGSNTSLQLFTITLTAPEIGIKGNSVDIANGDTMPTTADHTDFGSTLVTGGSVARTFTIINRGTAALNLTGTAPTYVTLTGTGAAHFSVTTQPAAGTITSGGGTQTFVVNYAPSAAGIHTATVSIGSNDSDENPYNFSIQGIGYTAAQAAAAAWASSFPGISGADTAPEATPFNDGIANLLKYAFNVPLDGPRVAQMTQGTGTSGMPAITFDTTTGTPTSLRIEFLRRKSSGLIYTPQYGYTLASFVPTTAAPVVTSIDANWERVVVVQPLTSGQDRAFSRVAVTAP